MSDTDGDGIPDTIDSTPFGGGDFDDRQISEDEREREQDLIEARRRGRRPGTQRRRRDQGEQNWASDVSPLAGLVVLGVAAAVLASIFSGPALTIAALAATGLGFAVLQFAKANPAPPQGGQGVSPGYVNDDGTTELQRSRQQARENLRSNNRDLGNLAPESTPSLNMENSARRL
ncbi:MAG: hypothetical protein MK137_02095 [Rickettsiales bacterium]|nr:hypothetical protein [Rickettsiales bacterium]